MAFTKITASGIGSTETVTLDGLSVINDGSFGGNVSVGGTLTYEDVTNIDSVGLITARAGVVVGSGITLSKDGDGFYTGVVTATSYAGDGSGLTGIAATDNVRTGILDVAGVGTFRNDVNIPDKIIHLGDTNTAIRFPAADTITAETGGSERVRITSSGAMGLGTNDPTTKLHVQQSAVTSAPSRSSALYLENNANCEIQFVGNSSNDCQLRFGTSSNSFKGAIEYELDNNNLIHYTNGGERARIDSSGNMGIGTDNPAQAVHINRSSGDSYLRIQGGTNQGTLINKTDGTLIGGFVSGGVVGGSVNDIAVRAETSNNIVFAHGTTERLRVTSDGYLQQHKLIAVSYSDSRELAVSGDLTTSNFYNHTNFASDTSILDSNGHFVAPIHGIYRLYCRFSTDTDTGNRINVRLRKNGITINEAYGSNESVNGIQSVSSEIIMELDANEYFDLEAGALNTMAGTQHKVVNFHMLG